MVQLKTAIENTDQNMSFNTANSYRIAVFDDMDFVYQIKENQLSLTTDI